MSDATQAEAAIFAAVIGLNDPHQRQALLDAACRDDLELRRRIDQLLAANAEADSFMQQPASDFLDKTAVDPTVERPGTKIGNYKLLEQIGEGGFGVVYMADQLKPIERRIALKVIKPGMDTKQVIARFEAERQALALMDHPNIAKILDAGTTEKGRPYFVMELVRGIPVMEYCNNRNLRTEERLRVFMQICSAVQHAHQKGIIHRDIKPSNILVATNGDEAVPKVIDFGIAKATQGRLTDKTLFTQFRQFIGTPAYMSPEQAQMSAVDVDTRSDIYSLGVLLYELLTGKTPLDTQSLVNAGYEEICRRVREEEAVKPSKRLSSLQQDELTTLARQRKVAVSEFTSSVRGDLDWIVMKAVEKDRSRRYDSCGALAADIDRYLKNEPVVAGPPSAAYHLRKFMQRNRTATITSLAVATSLLLGTVLATYGMLSARSESRLKEAANEQLKDQINTTNVALNNAEASRDAERAAKKVSEHETKRAVKSAYLADMRAAFEAMKDDNFRLATRILDETRNFPPDRDPRNWEWRALWKYCQGNYVRKLGVADGPVDSISLSRDDKWLAAGGGGKLRIWNLRTGELHATLVDGEKSGCRTAFAADGKLLYATEKQGTIRAWTVPDFKPTTLLMTHGDEEIIDIEVSPDGKWLVSMARNTSAGSYGGVDVTIWDLATGELRARLPIASGAGGGSLGISADSSILAQGTTPCRLVDLNTLEELHVLEETCGRGDIEFSPDGKFVAIAEALSEAKIYVFSVADGKRVTAIEGHLDAAKGLDFSPKGQLLASASADQTIRLWNASHQETAKFRGHANEAYCVKFTSDGKRLVSAGKAGEICIFDVEGPTTSKSDWPVFAAEAVWYGMWNKRHSQISFSPDSRTLACTRDRYADSPTTGGIDLRQAADLKVVGIVDADDGFKTGVRYSPVDDLLAIGNTRGSLALVYPHDPSSVTRIQIREDAEVFPSQFSQDGRLLLVAARNREDTELVLTSVVEGKPVARWLVPKGETCALSFDGRMVVTGHADGIRIWDVENTGQPVRFIDLTEVFAVDFSPDARSVAASTAYGLVLLVDVDSGEVIQEFVGHRQHVGAVQFSPDGMRLASAGNKADSLIVWDVETGREIATLRTFEHAFSNRQVEWSPDGNSILLMGGGADVSIWRVPSWDEITKREAN